MIYVALALLAVWLLCFGVAALLGRHVQVLERLPYQAPAEHQDSARKALVQEGERPFSRTRVGPTKRARVAPASQGRLDAPTRQL